MLGNAHHHFHHRAQKRALYVTMTGSTVRELKAEIRRVSARLVALEERLKASKSGADVWRNTNKRTFGKSALCTASCPDDERTGYPGAYQWYDAEAKLWRWLFVGSSSERATPKSVERQANTERRVPIGGRVRFVFVEKWIHTHAAGRRGWRAQIRFVVEARKTKNAERQCPGRKR